jgi:hypothetical protein
MRTHLIARLPKGRAANTLRADPHKGCRLPNGRLSKLSPPNHVLAQIK